MRPRGRYLYCVIKGAEKRTFGMGFHGNVVYTLPYRGISAVVSEMPPVESEPNEANVLTHEEVVERVMQENTVLPFGFGNVFLDEGRVKWLLTRFYWRFKNSLQELEGKVEVGVKVFYDLEVAKRDIEPSYEKAEGQKESHTTAAAENRYENANEKAYELGVKVYEELRKNAEATCLMKRIGGNMILNGAFLVQKGKIEDFKIQLERLEKEYTDKGLEFRFSGPWPPYNFVRIRINR